MSLVRDLAATATSAPTTDAATTLIQLSMGSMLGEEGEDHGSRAVGASGAGGRCDRAIQLLLALATSLQDPGSRIQPNLEEMLVRAVCGAVIRHEDSVLSMLLLKVQSATKYKNKIR